MYIFAKKARLCKEWAENIRVFIDKGHISGIEIETNASQGDIKVDTLLPAIPNLHSHSFQRAMAGMTEYRARDCESFWTWRDLMYSFLEHLLPEDIMAIAAMTFLEMQKSGYASVGEFHYIHHSQGGRPYENAGELSHKIMEAALMTGIGLTHLPVLYSYNSEKLDALVAGQLRFRNTLKQFEELFPLIENGLKNLWEDARMGIAAHSLRAVSPDDLCNLAAEFTNIPFHLHISEQEKEVKNIMEAHGVRPVEWLLKNLNIDPRWCLIHATHMTDWETTALAQSGAIVGLCPITEANLGDGVFNGTKFLKADGVFGIGSDSNINISLTEELRTLEYSQRLVHKERNIMVKGIGSIGESLYLGAASGGAQALGRPCGKISTGMLADLVAIDSSDPSLFALPNNQLLDGFVFAANDNVVTDVWSAGRHQVRDGRHIAEEEITNLFRKTMVNLRRRLI